MWPWVNKIHSTAQYECSHGRTFLYEMTRIGCFALMFKQRAESEIENRLQQQTGTVLCLWEKQSSVAHRIACKKKNSYQWFSSRMLTAFIQHPNSKRPMQLQLLPHADSYRHIIYLFIYMCTKYMFVYFNMPTTRSFATHTISHICVRAWTSAA